MKEEFLHYVWRFQKFDSAHLNTTDNQVVHVYHPGHLNSDSGPDFQQARIKIGDLEWVGSVEIHLKSSDWQRHAHQNDAAYENVILHVVWEDDAGVLTQAGNTIPTIELKNKTDLGLLERYKTLLQSIKPIPCAPSFSYCRSISKLSMLEQALTERLEIKAKEIFQIHEHCEKDWAQTTLVWLFRNFGFRLNAQPFEQVGKALKWQWLAKHNESLFQIEALLFGLSGWLGQDFKDEYPRQLKKEWEFFRNKYSLEGKEIDAHLWKFLRLRPANFPSLRMAELAAFLHACPQPYQTLELLPDLKKLDSFFKASVSDYWRHHYHFRKEANVPNKGMGKSSRDLLIINWAAPLLFSLGLFKGEQQYKEQALEWLLGLSAEKNRILNHWEELGWKAENAFESQGLIGLYKNYCSEKRCISCKIGVEVMGL